MLLLGIKYSNKFLGRNFDLHYSCFLQENKFCSPAGIRPCFFRIITLINVVMFWRKLMPEGITMKSRIFQTIIFQTVLLVQTAYPQWKPVSSMEGGYVTSIVASGSTLLAETFSGGVFRSTDNGNSWHSIRAALNNFTGASFYQFGTSIYYPSSDTIMVSDDFGETWSTILFTPQKLATDPPITPSGRYGVISPYEFRSFTANETSLFVATRNGVYRSNDKGSTWLALHPGITDTVFEPIRIIANGSMVLLQTENTFFRSSDNGDSWNTVYEKSDRFKDMGNFIIDDQLILTSSYSSSLWSIDLNPTPGSILRSDDNGITWEQSDSELFDCSFPLMAICGSTIVAVKNDPLLEDDCSIYHSNDNGVNWTTANSASDFDIQCLVSNGTTLYAGTYSDGVIRSDDKGVTWQQISNGLISVNAPQIASAGSRIVISEYAVGSKNIVHLSEDYGTTWSTPSVPSNSGMISSLAVDSQIIFYGTVNNYNRLYRSDDRGVSWTTDSTGYDDGISSVASNGSTVIIGNCYLYRSADHGVSWEQVQGLNTSRFFETIKSINGVFFTSNGSEVYRSIDDGVTWVKDYTGLEFKNVTTFTGVRDIIFAGTFKSGLYRSTDNGATWTAAASDIILKRITSLVSTDSILFAGTGNPENYDGVENNAPIGVFLSRDYGKSWEIVGSGIPDPNIGSLVICGDRLFAQTATNGVWHRSVAEMVNGENRKIPVRKKKGIVPVPIAPAISRDFIFSSTLTSSKKVTIGVFTLTGQLVASPVNRIASPGLFSYKWNPGGRLSPGCYIVRFTVGSVVCSQHISVSRTLQ